MKAYMPFNVNSIFQPPFSHIRVCKVNTVIFMKNYRTMLYHAYYAVMLFLELCVVFLCVQFLDTFYHFLYQAMQTTQTNMDDDN